MSLASHLATGRGEGPADFVGEIHLHFPVPVVHDSFHLTWKIGEVGWTAKDDSIGHVKVLFGCFAGFPKLGDYSRHTIGSFDDAAGHLLRIAGVRVVDYHNSR